MRILIFNWRDIKNPEAGGAELFTHENAKRWVAKGHDVTLFTSRFPNCKCEEIIDGVKIIRDGGKYTVYWKAREHYKKQFQGEFDVIIDEVNTLPFFTPLYVKEPIVCLIHQLAVEFWFYEVKFPFSLFGYVLEPYYLKLYRKVPTLTVSESTKHDLLNLGFSDVYVIPEGLNQKPLEKIPEKEKEPTLLYVGRLKKAKRPDHVIEAFKLVKKRIPKAKLWIVGDGYFKQYLMKIVRKYSLDDVQFFGRISERKKIDLMKRAHVIVVPSIREGWGLIITEANACGTPAIGYIVPGLRDAIKNEETGLLTEKNDQKSLAKTILKFFEDNSLKEKLTKNALKWSHEFSWDNSACVSLEILEQIVRKTKKSHINSATKASVWH